MRLRRAAAAVWHFFPPCMVSGTIAPQTNTGYSIPQSSQRCNAKNHHQPPTQKPVTPHLRHAGFRNAAGSSWAAATHSLMPATTATMPFKSPGVNSGASTSAAKTAPAGSARPDTSATTAPLARLPVAQSKKAPQQPIPSGILYGSNRQCRARPPAAGPRRWSTGSGCPPAGYRTQSCPVTSAAHGRALGAGAKTVGQCILVRQSTGQQPGCQHTTQQQCRSRSPTAKG